MLRVSPSATGCKSAFLQFACSDSEFISLVSALVPHWLPLRLTCTKLAKLKCLKRYERPSDYAPYPSLIPLADAAGCDFTDPVTLCRIIAADDMPAFLFLYERAFVTLDDEVDEEVMRSASESMVHTLLDRQAIHPKVAMMAAFRLYSDDLKERLLTVYGAHAWSSTRVIVHMIEVGASVDDLVELARETTSHTALHNAVLLRCTVQEIEELVHHVPGLLDQLSQTFVLRLNRADVLEYMIHSGKFVPDVWALHWSARNSTIDVFILLAQHTKASASHAERCKLLGIAAEAGNLAVFKHITKMYHIPIQTEHLVLLAKTFQHEAVAFAVRHGLRELPCEKRNDMYLYKASRDPRVFDLMHHNIKVRLADGTLVPLPFSLRVFLQLIASAHVRALDVLVGHYAKECRAPHNKRLASYMAVRSGRIHMLQWVRRHIGLDLCHISVEYAAKHRLFSVLRYVMRHYSPNRMRWCNIPVDAGKVQRELAKFLRQQPFH